MKRKIQLLADIFGLLIRFALLSMAAMSIELLHSPRVRRAVKRAAKRR